MGCYGSARMIITAHGGRRSPAPPHEAVPSKKRNPAWGPDAWESVFPAMPLVVAANPCEDSIAADLVITRKSHPAEARITLTRSS